MLSVVMHTFPALLEKLYIFAFNSLEMEYTWIPIVMYMASEEF